MRTILALLLASAALAASAAETVSLARLVGGDYDGKTVCTEGLVDDLFIDDVDPNYLLMSLRDGTATILVSAVTDILSMERANRLVGTRVRISGRCQLRPDGARNHTGWRLFLKRPTDLTVLAPPSESPFDCPSLASTLSLHPQRVAQLGHRRMTGTVVACWQPHDVLLVLTKGTFARLGLCDDTELPAVGSVIEAAGTVETDLFHVNLSRARYRLASGDPLPMPSQHPFSLRELYHVKNGNVAYNFDCFGHPARIRGTVSGTRMMQGNAQRTTILCDGHLIEVDLTTAPSAAARLPAGSTVEITGIVIHEVANCTPGNPLPHITGLLLVPQKPADVVLVAAPPWWTAERLFAVIVALAVLVLAILTWVVLLRRLAERRGRELAAETIARAETEFKVYERTRLAVELHDAIAQTLTGLSFEIDTARRFSKTDTARMDTHLDIAAQSLQSCRDELRNCLWDLRNHALEIDDLNEAIRQTLEPHLGEADLTVRFNVPRSLLSDSTTHALLRIIRELASNGVRHGQATHIHVAGAIEADRLLFSVRDNGRGFDPSACPGLAEGHYGLQGIRERIDTLGGIFDLTSAPGQGTKAVITLQIPKEPTT